MRAKVEKIEAPNTPDITAIEGAYRGGIRNGEKLRKAAFVESGGNNARKVSFISSLSVALIAYCGAGTTPVK